MWGAPGSDRLATRGGEGTPWRRVLLTFLTRGARDQIKLFRASNCVDVVTCGGGKKREKGSRLQNLCRVCNSQQVEKGEFEKVAADYLVCMNAEPWAQMG